MEENISERSGFVRLALGTGLTACGIAHLAKESGNRGLGTLFVAAGALKVAEGIFLYCPMKAVINSNVKEAVATTFDEYLDGDSIMRAYNDFYVGKWGSKSQQSQSQSGSSSPSGNSTNYEKAASDIGEIVSNVTQNDTLKNVASKAVKAEGGSTSSNQNKQNRSTNNGQNASNPS